MQFKVLMMNQRKMIGRLLLSVLSCFLLCPVLITLLVNSDLSKELFLFILIVTILSFLLLMYLMLKPAYHKEVILLDDSSISTSAYGRIDFFTISSVKLKSYNTFGVEIKLNNGFRLVVMPSNQFSSSANETLTSFYFALTRNHGQWILKNPSQVSEF